MEQRAEISDAECNPEDQGRPSRAASFQSSRRAVNPIAELAVWLKITPNFSFAICRIGRKLGGLCLCVSKETRRW